MDPEGESLGLALKDAVIVVRGGISPLPPRGETFSGAFGLSVEDAGAFVPHGMIRIARLREIVESGGTVVARPEFTRLGILNARHVDVTLGDRVCFSKPVENPVPKVQRIR